MRTGALILTSPCAAMTSEKTSPVNQAKNVPGVIAMGSQPERWSAAGALSFEGSL
jgi:hypothetical protein